MVYTDVITREELADIFFNEKDPDTFYDIFESDGAGPRFDCVHSEGVCAGDGECYIIDRDTGSYINWYKLYHFGRDYNTNMATKEAIINFARDFYSEADKDWNSRATES